MLVTIFTSLNNRFNQSSLMFRKISNPYYWKKSNVKTLLMSQGIKGIYNGEMNITQFEIEADVLRVIFYEKIVDCFDSFLSEIWKLPREQRLLLPCTVHIISTYSSIQPLHRQQSNRFPLWKEWKLGSVPKWSQWKSMRCQFWIHIII